MFVCGLDVGRTSMRLVLMVDCPEAAPEFLEARRFARSAYPREVAGQLDIWSDRYGIGPDAVVCCSSDRVPDSLLCALEGKAPVEWVDGLEVRKALAVWRSQRPDRQWLRGGLLGLLFSSPMAYPSWTDNPNRAALEWDYAYRRRQILDVEAWLMAEGRMMCPGHLNPTCPYCEAPWENQKSWEDVPF